MYLVAAICHLVVLQTNKRRGHKFLLSAPAFGFCIARITTQALRIGWAYHPDNVRLAMAAQILVQAGVFFLLIINLFCAQRIVRAFHPRFGWSKPANFLFKFLLFFIIIALALVITVVVQSFYTLNPNTRRIDHDIQIAGSSYMLFLAFLPIPLVLISVAIPRRGGRIDHFGKGSYTARILILLFVSTLTCLGAAFRTATTAEPPRLESDPAWYDNKAAFYCFNFALEIIVLYTYLLARFDLRFHVPDGSGQLQHYNGPLAQGWPVAWYDASVPRETAIPPVLDLSTDSIISTINIDIDEKNFI